jgi:hypothetical protein
VCSKCTSILLRSLKWLKAKYRLEGILSLRTLDIHGVSGGSVKLRSGSNSLYHIPLGYLLCQGSADWQYPVFTIE